MELINDIINELVDSERSITSPLLKTKVLATRLKNAELLNWTNKELNGYNYNDNDILPEYRKSGCSIMGSYINGNMKISNQPLPTQGLPKVIEKLAHQFDFYQSVTTLESFEKQDESGRLEMVFPAEIAAYIEGNIKQLGNPYIQLITAKKVVPISVVTQILSVIRSKLLDFMLKIDEEFGNITTIEDLKSNNEKITTIMSQTIITNSGDGNVINTGNNNNIDANIKINKGDQEALKKTLEQSGISESDTKELIQIVDSDIPKQTDKGFGPKVNSWIQKMLGKALDGSWQMSVGAAGNLLADAISSYYGIK